MGASFPSDALLRALLDVRGPMVRDRIGGRTRHHLQRIGAGSQSWVLKTYARSADVHFAHRFRREERILTLLESEEPGLAPGARAGVINRDWACLVMEDLGSSSTSLRRALAKRPAEPGLVESAVRALCRWHAFTDRFHDLLAAFCQSIVLDRNERDTLAQRHRVALRRTDGAISERAAEAFVTEVIDPLLESPWRVIHNSANVLNMVVRPDSSIALIDYETVALGPLELDLAELAVHPDVFGRSGLDRIAALYAKSFRPLDKEALARAGILRAIDACGALAGQARRTPDSREADGLRQSSRRYLSVAHRIAEAIGIDRGGMPAQ